MKYALPSPYILLFLIIAMSDFIELHSAQPKPLKEAAAQLIIQSNKRDYVIDAINKMPIDLACEVMIKFLNQNKKLNDVVKSEIIIAVLQRSEFTSKDYQSEKIKLTKYLFKYFTIQPTEINLEKLPTPIIQENIVQLAYFTLLKSRSYPEGMTAVLQQLIENKNIPNKDTAVFSWLKDYYIPKATFYLFDGPTFTLKQSFFEGKNIIETAISSNRLDVVKKLLEHGVSPDLSSLDYSPLSVAIGKNNLKAVQLLLDRGANLLKKIGKLQGTAFHIAAVRAEQNIFDFLLEYLRHNNKLADAIQLRTKNGVTPLHSAANTGNEYTTSALLKENADKDAQDNFGNTPLHYASREGKLKIIKLLLQAGANKTITNQEGKKPIDLAKGTKTKRLLE